MILMYIVATEIAGAVMDAIFCPQFDLIARYGNSSALFAAGCCPFISFKLHGVSYHKENYMWCSLSKMWIRSLGYFSYILFHLYLKVFCARITVAYFSCDKFLSLQRLCDNDPGVMGATLCPLYDLITIDVNSYKDLVVSFVSILKQVAERRLPKSYDYHQTPAPFIQVVVSPLCRFKFIASILLMCISLIRHYIDCTKLFFPSSVLFFRRIKLYDLARLR